MYMYVCLLCTCNFSSLGDGMSHYLIPIQRIVFCLWSIFLMCRAFVVPCVCEQTTEWTQSWHTIPPRASSAALYTWYTHAIQLWLVLVCFGVSPCFSCHLLADRDTFVYPKTHLATFHRSMTYKLVRLRMLLLASYYSNTKPVSTNYF